MLMAELGDREFWSIDEIPPEIRALISRLDLQCMADDGLLDRGTMQYLVETAASEWPQPHTRQWVLAAVEANPGVWISRLCRGMHNRSETYRSIAWCGRCEQYANRRKRKLAAALPENTLPGLDKFGGAYQLHPPCSRYGLTWLRHQVYRLVELELITKLREKCLDLRQPRGWDWMSTLYPTNSCFSERKNYNEQKENTDRNNRLLQTVNQSAGAHNKFVRMPALPVFRRFFEDDGGDA